MKITTSTSFDNNYFDPGQGAVGYRATQPKPARCPVIIELHPNEAEYLLSFLQGLSGPGELTTDLRNGLVALLPK